MKEWQTVIDFTKIDPDGVDIFLLEKAIAETEKTYSAEETKTLLDL